MQNIQDFEGMESELPSQEHPVKPLLSGNEDHGTDKYHRAIDYWSHCYPAFTNTGKSLIYSGTQSPENTVGTSGIVHHHSLN